MPIRPPRLPRPAVLAASLALLVVLLALPAALAQSLARGSGGAVATVDERATAAALDVLRLGGTAVDATVAAAAVLNVTDPFSAGIGGGGFMLVYDAASGDVFAIDGREAAPAAARPDMFLEDGEPIPFFPERISSGLAVGVPGTLAQWTLALERFGSLDLATVLRPAIRIAEDGFEIDGTFADQLAFNAERFAVFPATAELYLTDAGEVPEVGSVHRNPDLAATLRLIAERGPAVFYGGEIGADLVAAVQSPATVAEPSFTVRGQQMTLADLRGYSAIVRAPVRADYRGFEVYGMGPPSSGGLTVGLILGILEGFDMGELAREDALHRYLEASRLAYTDRGATMGDSDFVNVPVAGLLSEDFATARRELIGDEAAESYPVGDPFAFQDDPSPPLAPPQPDTEGESTSHITVVDRFGNAVAYTITIETTGGSGIVVPGRGFLLNNELTDFSSDPVGPNAPEPGKRPRSSMSPTIALEDGELRLALGSPGGSTIITTVTQILLNVIDFGMPIDEALAAPRLSQRGGSTTTAESALGAELFAALEARGHTFRETDEIGAATAVYVEPDGTLVAAAEAERRGGGHAGVVDPAE